MMSPLRELEFFISKVLSLVLDLVPGGDLFSVFAPIAEHDDCHCSKNQQTYQQFCSFDHGTTLFMTLILWVYRRVSTLKIPN